MKNVSFNDAYVFLDSLPSIEKDIMELVFTTAVSYTHLTLPTILLV